MRGRWAQVLVGGALAVAGARGIGLPVMAQEKVDVLIEVGKPGERSVPIAIPRPVGSASEIDAFWTTVRRDLEISGWFRVIDPKAYIEPPGAGLRAGEFDFQHWRTPGAAVLAKTSLGTSGENLRTETYVYFVAGGQQLAAKAFSAPPTSVRALGHRVADMIVRAVTGEASFFDTKIAVAYKAKSNKEIAIVDVDGQARRAITSNKSINLKPRWNRAGTKLCLTSFFNNNPDLYVADLLAGQLRRISSRSGINTGCAWSPAGDTLALTLSVGGDSEIFTIDPVAGSQVARLTESPGIDVSPSWSPDGTQLAFVSERGGGPQVYVMDVAGGSARRVTFQGAHNTDPAWSPTGERIAFVGRDGNFDVFTVQPDGRGMERVTQGQGDNEDPSWSPDGKFLVFSSNRGGSYQLYLSSADGRHQVRLTDGVGEYTNPHWSGHLSW